MGPLTCIIVELPITKLSPAELQNTTDIYRERRAERYCSWWICPTLRAVTVVSFFRKRVNSLLPMWFTPVQVWGFTYVITHGSLKYLMLLDCEYGHEDVESTHGSHTVLEVWKSPWVLFMVVEAWWKSPWISELGFEKLKNQCWGLEIWAPFIIRLLLPCNLNTPNQTKLTSRLWFGCHLADKWQLWSGKMATWVLKSAWICLPWSVETMELEIQHCNFGNA